LRRHDQADLAGRPLDVLLRDLPEMIDRVHLKRMKIAAALIVAVSVAVTLGSQPAAQGVEPAIVFGNHHAVALQSNGNVLTWGEAVYCQLGRASRGNSSREPGLVMRNAKQIAAAADHTLALTEDGKVYGWGMNPEGALGLGNTNDQCEGPALIESLSSVSSARIATGHGFSVAVTTTGDLYCAGDNGVGQCPVARSGDVLAFTKVAIPELAGNVADVRSGLFHTLILGKDRKLYALGRGRDGQLGNGKSVNGFTIVPEMTDVVSFAAGTWHSVAARADGTVWTWGNDGKSQLCDGGKTNRPSPAQVALPAGIRVTHVAAGGHSTLMRASDGSLLGCGDNQFGPLGIDQPIAPEPTPIKTTPLKSSIMAIGGANAAVSVDGCDVRLTGANDYGIVSAADVPSAKSFTTRANLSLCSARSATTLDTIVNPAPRGGESNCWAKRVEEDGSTSPKFAALRTAMLAAEAIVQKNAALTAAPQPVRFRTSLSAGPLDDAGARMHIKVVPERKQDGTRIWSTGCEVIPQLDRIGGAIAQISIFFNQDRQFISAVADPPKLTGNVAGYPVYDGWIVITKDQRLPWLPQTLADRLDEEGATRERALADAKRRPAGIVKDDAAGGIQWLEKQVRDYQQYRGSFTPEQLQMPAVLGVPAHELRKRLDAEANAMRKLSPADQQQVDAVGLESRNLARQAQVETRNKNLDEAERLRKLSTELAFKVREIQQAHQARTVPLILDQMANAELRNLQPGSAERAVKVKRDRSFPDMKAPNRIQVITVMLSFGPKPAGAQLDWQNKVTSSFDFATLAALLQ
jgi:hypothetical protein